MSVTLALALTLGAAPPVQAQAPPAAEPIVVEGRDTRARASDYVDKVLPTTFAGQFGRYEDPLCPKIVGLADTLGSQVAARIRLVARFANIEVAPKSCTPNLIVIVAPDKKSMIETMRKSRPLYLRKIGADALNRLASSPRPFASWQVSDVIGADGMHIGEGDSFPRGGSGASDSKGTFIDGDFARVKTTVSPSRLRAPTKPRVLASVVIVETGALANATVRQLADFALVRALTPTETRRVDAPTSSILGLFNPGVRPEGGPQSVTWWDVAFLKSLTNTRSDAYANIQRNEIRNQMIKEVEKAPTEQR